MKKLMILVLFPGLLLGTGCLHHTQDSGHYQGGPGYDPDLDGSGDVSTGPTIQQLRQRQARLNRLRSRRLKARRRKVAKMKRRQAKQLRHYHAKMGRLAKKIQKYRKVIANLNWRARALLTRYRNFGYVSPRQQHHLRALRSRLWRYRRGVIRVQHRMYRLRYRYMTRYGHFPKHRTYATRGRTGFAPPPPGWRSNRTGTPKAASAPKVTPHKSDAFPTTPPPAASNPKPSPDSFPSTPPPSTTTQPKDDFPAQPPSSTPAPTHPVAGKDIQAWQAYCASEKKRYPSAPFPKFLSQKQWGKSFLWKAKTYRYDGGYTVRPIHSRGGRFAVLGMGGRYSQAHCEDRPFYVWDGKLKRIRSLRPPVRAFLLKNKRYLPWFQGAKHAPVKLTLVHFDPSQRKAGILLRASVSATQKRRYRFAFLQWDIQQQRITRSWELGPSGCMGAFKHVGVAPDGRSFYYLSRREPSAASCKQIVALRKQLKGSNQLQALMKMDIQTGQSERVASITHKYKIESVVPNKDFTNIAVVEYTEMKNEHGRVYVVDTRTKKASSHAIPRVPYGVVFTPDQSTLLVYGSKQGQLARISLQTGQQKSFKTYRRGHAIGFSRDGKWLYLLFHSGIEVRDAKTLNPVSFTSHRAMMGKVKFLHVDGSAIGGGVALVKNESTLYAQFLTNKKPSRVSVKTTKRPSRRVKAKMLTATPHSRASL